MRIMSQRWDLCTAEMATGGETDAESDPGLQKGDISSNQEFAKKNVTLPRPPDFPLALSVELGEEDERGEEGKNGGRQQKICAT